MVIAKPWPDGRLISVAPKDVTVTMRYGRPIAVFNPRYSSTPVATYSSRTTFKVPVRGDIMVAQIG